MQKMQKHQTPAMQISPGSLLIIKIICKNKFSLIKLEKKQNTFSSWYHIKQIGLLAAVLWGYVSPVHRHFLANLVFCLPEGKKTVNDRNNNSHEQLL